MGSLRTPITGATDDIGKPGDVEGWDFNFGRYDHSVLDLLNHSRVHYT